MRRALAFTCLLGCASALAGPYPVRSNRKLELGVHEGVPWPIINAPIDGPLPDAPVSRETQPEAPTKAGTRVLEVIDEIEETVVETAYQASTKVNAKQGEYRWDCSGMAAWILRRAAPDAFRKLGSKRPVARDFVTAIERAPTKGARGGWQRVTIAAVMPGDVFAWRRPRGMPSKNTGHVGFVVEQPVAVPEINGAWAVRIADSTRGYHQNDARSGNEQGGFGIGTLVFLTDDAGDVTAYGWSGTLSEWYVVTHVVFGRPHG